MTRTTSILATVALALMAACDDASGPVTQRCADGPSADERAANLEIFEGLQASCEGCHIMGARGYFASIEAFEALVAYNPELITPGAPDASPFVALLEAKGTGPFVQMPPAGPSYAQLVDDGTATLSMTQIRDWVTALGDHAADPNPSSAATRITRLGANDIQRALYQQLGLSDDDFFVPASEYGIPHKSTGQSDEKYPMSSLASYPAPFPNEANPVDRFASLGGGSAVHQKKTDPSISPSFAGSLAQIAQRWCALALDKADNTTLLPSGATVSTGSSDAAAVKTVIRSWYLHFHATVATDDEVDRVFDQLFVPLEAGADPRTAYIGTCSYFIRHPDWVFY
ncbi:MAG: hypothetical protein K1X88_04885 [Nannocystaceae bacterium]|nr:hypothetical protein [Nannocystaceae bacterium]